MNKIRETNKGKIKEQDWPKIFKRYGSQGLQRE